MGILSDPRAVVPEGKLTIKSRILAELMAVGQAAPFDDDDPDGPKLFNIVKLGNLEDIRMAETPGLAIEEGPETATELSYMQVDKKMRVFFNVKPVRAGIDLNSLINYYFHRIVQLYVTTTNHFAGLALDIAEAGNSIQSNGSGDPEPGGSIYLDVDYRHMRGDWTAE